MMKYDPYDDAVKSYALAIATLRRQLLVRERIVAALKHWSKRSKQ